MTLNKEFAVTDFEASKWINYLCNGLYDGETYLEFTELSDYFDFLHIFPIKTIFAHFGGIYDFLFILGFVLDSTEWTIISIIPRGSSILCFEIESKINNNRLLFVDSSGLLSFSLRSLADNFDVKTKKGNIDYDKLTKVTPELLEYMKDDHLALYQVLLKFFQWDLIAVHGWKLTLASQALHIFKKEFSLKKLYTLDRDVDNFVRKSYQGGRTEIFKMVYNDNKNNLYCYDVNSLYPTVMLDNIFPSIPAYSTHEFIKGELGFYHCIVECPSDLHIPILGTKQALGHDSFIFPTGIFEGYWTEHELSYALENGYKILEIKLGLVFHSAGKMFKRYVNYFYNKRIKAKSETDKMICKLLLNSLYGRFGMDRDKEELALERHIEGEKFHSKVITPSGNEYTFCTTDKEIFTFTNVAVASYVTSYARVHMHKIFKKLKYNIYYTDTDSLFTPIQLKTSKKLGGLKEEYKVNQACFMLPKTYLVKSPDFKKVVMKGFDKKKIQHFEYDDFVNALEGDLKKMNKENTNKLSVKHDSKVLKFKSALKSGKMLSMSKPMIKRVCSKYNKRIVHDDFSTSPLEIKT